MINKAPIAIFCYRRPDHLRITLQSLKRCDGFEDSPIYIFGDGPRGVNDMQAVDATRQIARELLGEQAQYHFAKNNRGLAKSITFGIGTVLGDYDRLIVLEDDLELSPSFLEFMNNALMRYENNENVVQISGYKFDSGASTDSILSNSNEARFLPFTVSWGWGTWRRAWNFFDENLVGSEELLSNKNLRHRFNLNDSYDYTSMLIKQRLGTIDSWAIAWYWSTFRRNGLTLFPPISLINNIGFDGTGTHGKGRINKFFQRTNFSHNLRIDFPDSIMIEPSFFREVTEVIRQSTGGAIGRLRSFIRFNLLRTLYLLTDWLK